jgi:thiamine pyrophosphokinase
MCVMQPPSPTGRWFFMVIKRAVIFANGELHSLRTARACLQEGDLLVAADGGSIHLHRLGLIPAWLVGDLDSTPADLLDEYTRAGVRIMRYPVAKDETDLELAIRLTIAENYNSILVMAALGGRLDQTLGNLFLLARTDLLGCDVCLDDGREEVFLIRKNGIVHGNKGDMVSLIPINGDAQEVETEGLLYPLRGETLYTDRTRGISNVMEGKRAEIRIKSGQLMCIHRRKTH